MTDLRKANESAAYLLKLGLHAWVEPITIRYRDLVATIGYEVVIVLPKDEVPDAEIRVAGQDDQRGEPPA